MCPDGIAPCRTFGGTALGAAWIGTTEDPWTCSESLTAGAESGTTCRHTATGNTTHEADVGTTLQTCYLHITASQETYHGL